MSADGRHLTVRGVLGKYLKDTFKECKPVAAQICSLFIRHAFVPYMDINLAFYDVPLSPTASKADSDERHVCIPAGTRDGS